MSLVRISSVLFTSFVAAAVAAPASLVARPDTYTPSVIIDHATIIGKPNGTVVQYLGIPYAEPPVGDLRLRAPRPVSPYTEAVNATTFGNQCIQQMFPNIFLPDDVPEAAGEYLSAFVAPAPVPQSEDCLNLNVIVPANVTKDSKLPVAVWIYGGGFEVGSNAVEPGEVVVARSIEIGHPIVYVAMNYRLSGFGFLGGKEVKNAGVANLGLLDQREAFKWVQKYISAFGGDPAQVMIWGESAGGISVAHHMLANGGDPQGLFHAGFMQSGSPTPVGFVDEPEVQVTYDQIVEDTGCTGSSDTLACLRTVPVDIFTEAINKAPTFVSFQQVNTPWFPRADGAYIAEPPQRQLLTGSIANIPFVHGNDKDEGTVFSFPTLNITTDEQFLDYINANFYSNTPREVVSKILDLYPADPADGSPYDTGDKFAYSPQYKRMASFQGDFVEQAPRRLLGQTRASKQRVYAYLSDVNRVDGLGGAHGTELGNVYGGGDLGDYLIRFASTLDPNGNDAVYWPLYTNDALKMLAFSDNEPKLSIILDTYRSEGMAYLTNLSLADPM